MSLIRQHATRIDITNGHVSFDAAVASGLPGEKESIDLAVIGFANFMSGTYQQLTSDVQDITSTVTIDDAKVKNATFALLTAIPADVGAANFSSYGTTVSGTGSKLVIQAKTSVYNKASGSNQAGVQVLGASHAFFGNLDVWAGTLANVSDVSGVKQNQGLGSVLVQAAGAALFKSLGKNASIDNDDTVEGKQANLATAIDTAMTETAATYSTSTMFKRYLDSGRYYDDNADVGSSHAYNFKNANLDFIVQLSGTLSDSSGDTITNAVVNRILGTTLTDHKVALADKSYKMNILVRLQHRDDVA
jgi:hypothetical protein